MLEFIVIFHPDSQGIYLPYSDENQFTPHSLSSCPSKTEIRSRLINSQWRQRGRVVRASGFEIRRSRVKIPFWPPADVVPGSPEFNFSATLANSQLVCLPPVGILNLVMFNWILIYHCLFALVLKSPDGEWPITDTYILHNSHAYIMIGKIITLAFTVFI